jgi:hypothetical protein
VKSTEEMVLYILGTSYDHDAGFFPVRQMHLQMHVNFIRSVRGCAPIDRIKFARKLNQMRAKQILERVAWSSPCDLNLWRLREFIPAPD